MLQLRDYQSASIEALRNGFRDGHIRQVLAAPTGAGKARLAESMIKSAAEKGKRVMFLCERRVLVDQFSRHLENANIDHGVLMAKHWRFRPEALVQVASAQTLERMEHLPKMDIVFIDEVHACFVAGTLIDGRPIETIEVGDYVNSFNHKTGAVERKRVTATFTHKADRLVTVKSETGESFTCTEDHPVFTQNGYVKAKSLSHTSVLHLNIGKQHTVTSNVYTQTNFRSSVPPLWGGISSVGDLCGVVKKTWNSRVLRLPSVYFRKDGAIEDSQKLKTKTGIPFKKANELRLLWGELFSRVRVRVICTKKRFASFLRRFGVPAIPQAVHNREEQVAHARLPEKWWTGEDDSQQPNEERGHEKKIQNEASGDWSQATSAGREWAGANGSSVYAAVNSGRGMGGRAFCEDWVQEGRGVSNQPENRYSKQGEDDCNRGGWRKPQHPAGPGARCSEELSTGPSRVVSVEIQKSGNLAAGGAYCKAGQFVDVFNIEVEGNNNYFANGVLVHNCMRASVVKMLENNPSLKVVGLTATPFNPLLGKHFTSVTSVTTMRELVAQKFLVPFRVFVAKEIDTDGLKLVAGEWKKDDLEKRGQKIVGDIVADYIRISQDVFGGYRKTICFTSGIAHGEDLAKKFNEAGIMAVQISANDDDEYKAEILRDFARPDTDIKVVLSVAILSRGFDQSDVEHVILARPLKKSFSEHVQMIGRGARIHSEKQFCVIQDHSGNWLRFADDWHALYNNGVESLQEGRDAKPKKEPTAKEKEASKCPKCGCIWAGGDVCVQCGTVRVKRNDVVSIAGVMTEVGVSPVGAKKQEFSREYKDQFYAGLLGWARQKGYKPGAAYWAYKEKFGVGPAGAKPRPVPPSIDVQNWITHRNIRKAKGEKL